MRHWIISLVAQTQVQVPGQPGPGQPPPGPPLQPLPHPHIPEPILVPAGLPWWIYAGAGVLILALMGLVLWLLLRPQKARPLAPKQPWQTALKALRALRDNAGSVPPGEMAARVSEVLRRYFLERYGIPAPFRTTQEIFHRQVLPAASERLSRYAPLADLWDQLAFAPVPANASESAALVDRAINHLEEDRP